MQGDAGLVFFGGGAGDVLGAGRVAMPVIIVFHVVDAFAGDGVGDYGDGRLHDGLGHFAGIGDGLEVVAVDFDDVPAESGEFGGHIAERHHIFGSAIDLNIVAV